MLVEIWRPYYEDTFPALMGHDTAVIQHQHGNWADDQRRMVAGLHDSAQKKWLAVAVDDNEQVVGVVGWHVGERTHHAYIDPLGVSSSVRGSGLGRKLMDHCVAILKQAGIEFIEIGTGGDEFHAPPVTSTKVTAYAPCR